MYVVDLGGLRFLSAFAAPSQIHRSTGLDKKNSCIYSDPCSNPNATPRSTHQGVRSIPVRTGDEVVVTAGDHRKKAGKVIGVDRKKMKIHVEGITREKAGAKEAGKSACVVFAVVLGRFGW